jgi:hypothetical protein
MTDKTAPTEKPPACPECGCGDLYVRKDFPPALGCGIVAMAVAAFLFLSAWRRMTMWGFVVLLVAAGLDAVVHAAVGTVAVCYRCGRPVREIRDKTGLAAFDLSIAEKYRHGGDA